MFKTIKAQGFSIKENLDITLYKIDFPEEWFEEFYNNFEILKGFSFMV